MSPQLSAGFTVENAGNATISNFCNGKSTPKYDCNENKVFSTLSYTR